MAGAPTSVESEVEVWIENVARDERYSAHVAADGSFLMQVKWAEDEALQCWAQRQDKQSSKVSLLLPSNMPPPPSDEPLTIDSISPVADGNATVSGTIQGNSTLVIANRETGAAAVDDFDKDTDFSVTIAASPGDRLLVFSVATDTRRRKKTLEVSVPGP